MRESEDLDQTIRRRLREIRSERRISTDELAAGAARLGLDWTAGTITKIERGERRLSIAEFFVMLATLGLSAEAFFGKETKLRITPNLSIKGGAFARWMTSSRLMASTGGEIEARRTPEPVRLAEEKAARRLQGLGYQVDAHDVMDHALIHWGHSLTDEREARVSERVGGEDVTPRRRQALRGHVTRELLEGLELSFRHRKGKA